MFWLHIWFIDYNGLEFPSPEESVLPYEWGQPGLVASNCVRTQWAFLHSHFIWWANNEFSGEPSRGGLADTHALDSSWCSGFHLCPSFVHMPVERCEDTLARCLMNLDNVPAFGFFWSLITSAIYFFFVESHFNVSMVDAEFVKWTSLANHDQWALSIKG